MPRPHVNVLLVNAPQDYAWKRPDSLYYGGFYEYLGTSYLAACLKREGISVEILDAPFLGIDAQGTFKRILEFDFDILGISSNWQEFFPHTATLLRALQRSGMKEPVILGGHFPTIAHEALLKDFPGLFAICLGEGEATFTELCKALLEGTPVRDIAGLALPESTSSGILRTGLRPAPDPLDALPFPHRGLARSYLKDRTGGVTDKVAMNILSSRGCRGHCTFCTVHAFGAYSPGRPWRARTAANVVEEIEMLHREFGVSAFRFLDEDFLGRSDEGKARAYEIADEIRKRKLSIDFIIFARPDEIDEDLLRCLKDAGLSGVYVSVDAVTERDIQLYGKGTTREQIKKSLRTVTDLDLRLIYSVIFWHPYRRPIELLEFPRLIEEAADGDEKLARKLMRSLDGNILTSLKVLTGSPIEEKLRRDGLFHGDYRNMNFSFASLPSAIAFNLLKLISSLRLLVPKAPAGSCHHPEPGP